MSPLDHVPLIVLGLSAAPLVAYPGVLLASVMSLAGHRGERRPFDLVRLIGTLAFAVFLVLSLAYPLVVGASALAAWTAREADEPMGQLLASVVPLATLVLLAGLFAVDGGAERVAERRG